MEFKHQMIGNTLLFKYNDPVFNDIGIINYKRSLANLLKKHNVQDIILDVENIKILDNNGLSAIMFARRHTKTNSKTCVLAMARPKLMSLLRTAKLTESFIVINRKDEYQAYLKSLIEKADKEKAEREAEKARKAEEINNAKVEEVPLKENTAAKKNGRKKPKKKAEKKTDNT